jgi:polyhydroxybutyrate depolymerase
MLRLFDPELLWRGAIVVAAEGAPRRFPGLGSSQLRGWQIRSGEFEDRDLRLFDAILKNLQDEGCADSQRIYSTGFSNGGYFSNLLACKRGDVLAAVAPVSGGGPLDRACDAQVPILITHGTTDEVVPYSEGKQSFERWRAKNGCEGRPSESLAGCVDGSGCSAATRLCSFSGGHQWPSSGAPRIVKFLKSRSRQPSK